MYSQIVVKNLKLTDTLYNVSVVDTLLDLKLDIADTTNQWAPKGSYLYPSDTTSLLGMQWELDGKITETDLDSLLTVSPNKDSLLEVVTTALKDSVFTEDLRTPVSSIRLPGSGAPSTTLYLGGEVLEFPTNADAKVYFEVQMPHHRQTDSDVNIHVHYALSQDGTNPDSVRWVLTYTWANINAQFAVPTTVTHTEYVSTYVDSTHYYDVIATLDGTGKTLSSMLVCSLMRDVSEDDYAGSVYLLEIDVRYLKRNYTDPVDLF